jgi:hypothetical protein
VYRQLVVDRPRSPPPGGRADLACGQGLAEPGDISGGGDLRRVDELRGLTLHADLRAGRGPVPGLPLHPA